VRRHLTLVLGIAVSLVCLWLAMKDVRPIEVWVALRRADYVGFIALMVLTIFAFWLRALRWRWLVTTPKPLSLDSLFSATMIGFMANDLLPFRLGEFVRAWALGRREGIPKTTVFATIVVERVVDMITLLAIFGIALLLHPIPTHTTAGRLTHEGAKLLLVGSAALTVFLVVIERWPKLLGWFLDQIARRAPGKGGERGVQMLQHFVEGLSLFRDVPRLLWVFALSMVMFGVVAFGLSVSMWSFRMDTVPWHGGLIMLVVTAIGIMVPAAPGYIGTLNVACWAGLALFSVGKDLAAPFSWFYWAGQWIPVTGVGLWYLRREGLTLRAITHAQESGT
jgi:hypothetical protein